MISLGSITIRKDKKSHLSDTPGRVSQDVELIVHLPVTGDVDHRDPPPQFCPAHRVAAGLLVHVLQGVLDSLAALLIDNFKLGYKHQFSDTWIFRTIFLIADYYSWK